eukprot:TRINITY_DN6964_c0_g1_i1.p3 TRINITY_DN6964_c0_g1~~TRINITY_DN6964_c0_g1_i1.p3  ORF type:complete len:217 (+),score=84.63 TRINITY_DN6964_c0_g1_i1:2173-2823(+)
MDRTAQYISASYGDVEIKVKQGEDDLEHLVGHDATARWVWDAATPFAKWVCKYPERVKGKTAVEIGAGTGLVGIAAAKVGAKRVVLTDLPTELPLLRENVELNGMGESMEVQVCSWGDDEHLAALGQPDVVLVSDCLYGRESDLPAELLFKTLQALCGPHTHIYMAYCHRENLMADLKFFEDAMEVFEVVDHDMPSNTVRGGVEPHELWLIEYTRK